MEIGAFIDKQLYLKMAVRFTRIIYSLYIQLLQKSLKTKNERKIKEALLEAIHQIVKESKPFFIHESFFEKRGGFDLQINGVHIYKVVV